MSRTPDWQDAPSNLQSIFDEIGDPDMFSLRLQEEQTGITASQLTTVRGVGDVTPTQRFCSRWEKRVDNELDPIRLNRIKFYMFYIRQILGMLESLTNETIGVTLVGEGNETLVPNPLKAQLKILTVAFDVIQKATQTFRDNLGVCRQNRREIELDVAQCIELVDYTLPSKRDAVYFLVETKIENAELENVPVASARQVLRQAERDRDKGKWKLAYLHLCEAYRKIGT
jgi:hypothetical protein